VTQFSLGEMKPPILLTVPNISEGHDERTIAAIGEALTGGGARVRGTSSGGVRLLDVHSDGDHHRSVFTLAGQPGDLAKALLAGARAVVERIDIGDGRGEHPHVGSLDVAPIVYLDARARGAACAEALVAADRIGELEVPVLLYGEIAQGRTRAELRRGGVMRLAERMAAGEVQADFGPAQPHPTAGVTLVAARPPLVAFNLRLAPPATVEDARAIAALIREGGAEGLPGVRSIGVALRGAGLRTHESSALPGRSQAPGARAEQDVVAQVSTNVERPLEVPLAMVIEAVRRHVQVAGAELVGLAPRAALRDFPDDVPLLDFDPARHVIEDVLKSGREITI
jgi:glutamate formiminotransferase / 5-formyltetrahydrofolate cyclo-ligase